MSVGMGQCGAAALVDSKTKKMQLQMTGLRKVQDPSLHLFLLNNTKTPGFQGFTVARSINAIAESQYTNIHTSTT